MQGILNNGRFGMAGALTGTMKFLLAGAAEYAKSRKQFGRPIGEYGAIKGKLGEQENAQPRGSSRPLPTHPPPPPSACSHDRGQDLRHGVSGLPHRRQHGPRVRAGQRRVPRPALGVYPPRCCSSCRCSATDFHLEAAAAKVYASESVNQCADDALQVHGGVGYMKALPVRGASGGSRYCTLNAPPSWLAVRAHCPRRAHFQDIRGRERW